MKLGFAPTPGILVLRDIKLFVGNNLVPVTWPETSIQALKCRCIPTGSEGIVRVVSVLFSYTKSWHFLEVVPRDFF